MLFVLSRRDVGHLRGKREEKLRDGNPRPASGCISVFGLAGSGCDVMICSATAWAFRRGVHRAGIARGYRARGWTRSGGK